MRRSQSGQALIELALLLPVLLLSVVNVVNLGAFCFAWITLTNAARAGAEYMMLAGASVNAPTAATASQITTLVTNAAVRLPNISSLQVRVCTNNNGTTTCTPTCPVGGCSPAVPADPEAPTNYVLASVRVTYTYQPLIPLWEFPVLGVHATLPPTAMNQEARVRMLQ
jgi:Flp pilus assembly protein TadG